MTEPLRGVALAALALVVPTGGTSGEILVAALLPQSGSMFPANLLSVFAATSAAGDTKDGANGAGATTEFPGEQPSDKELADWLDMSWGP